MGQTTLNQCGKVVFYSEPFAAWDKIAQIMKDARENKPYWVDREDEKRKEKYFRISVLLEQWFEKYGTKEILPLIIRKPRLEDDNEWLYIKNKNTKMQLNHACFIHYMDLRFTIKQYLAFKYRHHATIITTVPLRSITRFFLHLNPWVDYVDHMSLDEIITTFTSIEAAMEFKKEGFFDKNPENQNDSQTFSI